MMSAKWKISQKKKTKPRTINRRLNADVQKNVKLALSLKRLANGVGFYSLPSFHFYFYPSPPRPKRYYTGDLKDEGKETKLSLEDAAKKVQISKKSLDDYLL